MDFLKVASNFFILQSIVTRLTCPFEQINRFFLLCLCRPSDITLDGIEAATLQVRGAVRSEVVQNVSGGDVGADTLGRRCLERCRFQHIARLQIDEGINRITDEIATLVGELTEAEKLATNGFNPNLIRLGIGQASLIPVALDALIHVGEEVIQSSFKLGGI